MQQSKDPRQATASRRGTVLCDIRNSSVRQDKARLFSQKELRPPVEQPVCDFAFLPILIYIVVCGTYLLIVLGDLLQLSIPRSYPTAMADFFNPNAARGGPQNIVENTAELKFGPDFEDITVLSNAHLAVLLQVSAQSSGHRDDELHEVYRSTQRYVERFNSMTNPEKNSQELVGELDTLQEALIKYRKETDDGRELELNEFEVASLMNLVATDTTVDEAKALIPSLSRFPDSAIDEILDLIRTTMIRIVS